MSDDLDRLANGVLWPGFFGTSAPEWLLEELRGGLAGVVYFGQNVSADLQALSAQLRAANPSLLIGIDEEGGSVTRLERESGSTLLGAAQLGRIDDTAVTRRLGTELALRLGDIGADVVLGPVADVNTDDENPVIGVRSFGDDTALVSRHAAAMIAGIHEGGALACAKHFPGHGDTHVDSHHDLPVIEVAPEEYEQVHVAPFSATIAAGVDMVMTAHIVVPHWGEQPATLNPKPLAHLRELGFDGVIVTDALDMAAIRETVGIGAGAVQALAAGADLLCIGNPTNPGAAAAADQDERDFRAAHSAIVAAMRDGSLPVERVREAAARVAAVAAGRRRRRTDAARLTEDELVSLARRAVRVRGSVPVTDGAIAVVDSLRKPTLAIDGGVGFLARIIADGGDVIRMLPEAPPTSIPSVDAHDRTVALLTDGARLSPAQRILAEQLKAAGAPALVVNVGVTSVDGVLPTLDVFAASRLSALAALSIIRGGRHGD